MILATAGGFFRHLDAGKWADIGQATLDTLLMLGGSLPLTLLIGLPLGVLLFLTGSPQLHRKPVLYGGLALLVNLLIMLSWNRLLESRYKKSLGV